MSITIGVDVNVENYDPAKEAELKAAIIDVFYMFGDKEVQVFHASDYGQANGDYNQLYLYAEGSESGGVLDNQGRDFCKPHLQALHAIDPTADATITITWLEEAPHDTWSLEDYDESEDDTTEEELPHYDAD